MKHGPWKTAAAAVAASATEVDLGADYSRVVALIPDITSTEVTIYIAEKSGGTFYAMYAFDADLTGSFAHATTSGHDPIAVVFFIGAAQYIKIVLATGTADVQVRGCNP